MSSFAATGALNPEPGATAAVMPVESYFPTTFQTPPPPANVHAPFGPEGLAAQILEAVARCRRLGHRDSNISLTRPTDVVAGTTAILEAAGLAVQVKPARVAGYAVLTVKG